MTDLTRSVSRSCSRLAVGWQRRLPTLLAAVFVAIATAGSQAANGGGSGGSGGPSQTPRGQSAPVSTSPPTISGSAVVGQTLSASPGSWSGAGVSYAYQWTRCDTSGSGCSPAAGATGSTYSLAAVDVGSTLRVVVTGSNKNGSATATSDPSAVVVAAPVSTVSAPSNTSLPTISGSASVSQSLSASTGSWTGSPTSYGYQWRRCDSAGASCSDVSGATSASYSLSSSDAGFTVRVAVTATNSGGSGTALSAQTAVVTAPAVPTNSSLPAISGSAIVAQSLSASAGSWTGSPTSYGYQWRRCDSTGASCAAVSGATSASYALSSSDLGFAMRVAVTATNTGGSATAVSTQTAVVTATPSDTTLPASFLTGPAGSGNVVPASGALLGLWTDGTWTTLPQNLLNRETQLGRKLGVYHIHYGASAGTCYGIAPFAPGVESWAWGRGVYSLISWSPGYTIAQVNSGAADACFRDVAQRFKAFGHPVWLRLWWEFNGDWFPWSYDPNNPQAFIDAWQRVVNIFKSVGATNTMFVWTPDEGYFNSSKTLQANGYPGDAYVDWVASDDYNWNRSSAWCTYHPGWCDFWEIFHHGASGSQARGVEVSFRGRKPFAVAETASVEDTSNATHKGQWMQNMAASIKSDFPDLRMLLYSDFDMTASNGVNWRIDTSPSSLAGFKTLAQDPYFNP